MNRSWHQREGGKTSSLLMLRLSIGNGQLMEVRAEEGFGAQKGYYEVGFWKNKKNRGGTFKVNTCLKGGSRNKVRFWKDS